MSAPSASLIQEQFSQTLLACRRLYLESGQRIAEQFPEIIQGGSPDEFVSMMDELHKALLVKVFACVLAGDRRLTPDKLRLAKILLEHIWNERLAGEALRGALGDVTHQAESFTLYSLVRPFDQIAPLRNRVSELVTIVMRLGNLVAKADGTVTEGEARNLRSLQHELEGHLVRIPIDEPSRHQDARKYGVSAVEQARAESRQLRAEVSRRPAASLSAEAQQAEESEELVEAEAVEEAKSSEQLLAEAKAQLEQLVGLATVKREIDTLTNFLRLQQHRAQAGLPATRLSLHLVFEGNPGTGKTSVARIVGQIYRGLGVLDKGHLVETDRSGLVAEFVGQTAPKTNRIIDEAMDGVLFIDEAYAIVSEAGDDAYGREALQTLLKRMEDDRERLVVIMAGYPEPMTRLLRVNPGLSSRINNRLHFEDYDVVELCQIFERMCDQNQYVLPAATRVKLLLGFKWLYEHRDAHFGNGRLVRNVFETAIRRLANRVADVVPITTELLTVLTADDIEFPGVPSEVFSERSNASRRFRLPCPNCGKPCQTRGDYLGRRVQCTACEHSFIVSWGEPL